MGQCEAATMPDSTANSMVFKRLIGTVAVEMNDQ